MLTFRQRGPGIAAWRDLLAGDTANLGAHLRGASPAASAPAAGGTAAAASPIAQRAAQRPAPVDTRGGALLVNDTSQWYHFGCSCTSLAIHAQLRAHAQSVRSLPIHRINRLTNLPRGVEELDDDGVFAGFAAAHGDIVAALESADKIYVNGEGTLHGLTPGAVGMLYLMHIAKTRFGRPVDLINHSCYPDDTATAKDGAAFAFYRKVYEALDYVAVRESVSAALVRQMGIASAAASFDCLPLFVAAHCDVAAVQRREKTVLIAGSVAWGGANVLPHLGELVDRLHGAGLAVHLLIGANAYLAADDARLAAALRARCGERFDLVCATSEREWLRAIASSSLLVSGRFHHTIAAAFLDTPFIVMESNTPKVAGLIGMLEAGTFVSAHEARLADLLYEHARRSITEGAGLLVGAERKAQLLELARANFRSATAREARH
jgi:polysaccharide pyruvyl transferase WcaK-like protein